jgi:hypothetical protein
MTKAKPGIGGSQYRVEVSEVVATDGTAMLEILTYNISDPYDRMLIHLTPSQAKSLTGLIYKAANELEKGVQDAFYRNVPFSPRRRR